MEYCIHDFKFIHSVTSVGQKGCVCGGGGWLGSTFKILDYIENILKTR